ncbi:hypothetical protein ACFPOI_30750 [Nonomuraea angiospora]|uniref:Transposase n=1 Tax=Nonomuraea angiospora TaxID=46172 RepID=A0ABR9LVX4_9ACTN|nr:hypothetical protein [Nonomuraea angiospora]MBE1584457.1 hypothetical protein [Nonomuraea angiospora]
MTLDADTVAAIDEYLAGYGRRRHRLTRESRILVESLVIIHGTDVLDRLVLDDGPCECCLEAQARVERLSWIKSEYRRKRRP